MFDLTLLMRFLGFYLPFLCLFQEEHFAEVLMGFLRRFQIFLLFLRLLFDFPLFYRCFLLRLMFLRWWRFLDYLKGDFLGLFLQLFLEILVFGLQGEEFLQSQKLDSQLVRLKV